MLWRFFHTVAGIITLFLFMAECHCTYIPHVFYPFIWIDTGVVSTSGVLWIMPLWMLECKYLFWVPVFNFFFGINLGMEFLCHTAILYLIFWGITKLFSTVAAPFYINSNVWSSNLSTFSSTFVIFLFYPLIIAILVCTKWYLIGVLIFISLMTNMEHLSCIHWPIGQMPIQVHYSLLNYIAYFCCYWAVGIHCIFLI